MIPEVSRLGPARLPGLVGLALALVATTQTRSGAPEPGAPSRTTLTGEPIDGAWAPGSR
jgi:hypothetical protein